MKTTERYHPSVIVTGILVATWSFMAKDMTGWGITVACLCAFLFLTCTSNTSRNE